MKFKKYISLFIISAFALLLLACGSSKKRVNWSPNFDSQYKTPFGTYIMYKELKTLFPYSQIKKVNYNTQQFLEEEYISKSTFIYFFPYIDFKADGLMDLKEFTRKKNLVFLSSYNFSNMGFTDSLQVFDSPQKFNYKDRALSSKKHSFTFTDPILEGKTVTFKGKIKGNYFTQIPQSATVLGNIIINGKEKPNFIKIPHKNGWFYLHLEPMVFTNIAMLDDQVSPYTQSILSHIPSQTIYWNNDRIVSRKQHEKSDGGMFAFLDYAWQQKALKYGIICLLIAGICIIVFNSSRRISPIEYKKSYKNDNLEYSKNLSPLFSKTQNYKYLSQHKINYFLHTIKDKYYISTLQTDEKWMHHFQQKSEYSKSNTETLINYITNIQKKGFCDKEQFTTLSQLLEQFYTQSNVYGKYKSNRNS